MTQNIKPKQCGENRWYIPNQKGFAPKIGVTYWACGAVGYPLSVYFSGDTFDYLCINSGNCFETKQEAIDAFVKPVDPTPLTWDELLEMEAAGGYPYTLGKVSKFNHYTGSYVVEMCFTTKRADDIRRSGRILFAANKYWRSKESLEAWIEKQKGE